MSRAIWSLFSPDDYYATYILRAAELVCGIWLSVAAMSLGVSNDLGQRFRRAADKNGRQIIFDGFDSAICEIPDGQEPNLFGFLHDVMIS